MIFGFNTDIKHEGTVYHVQSEARTHDQLLQTQVFVRGRCIGKHATSYADKFAEPGFSDEHMHDLLKTQHKGIIEAIRSGGLEQLFGSPALAAAEQTGRMSAYREAALSIEAHSKSVLTLSWVNSGAIYQDDSVVMRFAVSRNGSQVPGVQLTSRLTTAAEAPIYTQAITDAEGQAEMRILLDEAALADAAILVQATHEGEHATRKFRLRRGY